MLLATLMVPFAVVLVPLYVTVANLGLADKLAGIIVTSLCSTFGVFLMRQFMESIPNDLIDAGRIDGAGEWWIFRVSCCPWPERHFRRWLFLPFWAVGTVFFGRWWC